MGNNIGVPYSGFIPGGVTVGSEVVISGSTPHHFNSFSINLCVGPSTDQDTVLHFNPRLGDGVVVRNHKQGGGWGPEERDGGMPFHRGQSFVIHIKAKHDGYKISVDNRKFCKFRHRMSIQNAQFLYITGDVIISYINYRQQGGYPGYPSSAGPLYSPSVPLTYPIPGGLYPGKMIFISGIPNHNPSRFSVNLIAGPHESGDYGLHFDVRFNYGGCNNVVLRNHKQGGNWGGEEKHQNYFPFAAGANFEIMILVEPNSYKIAVNNQHFVEFPHRIHPVQRFDHLNITGDVRLTLVRFQ